MEWNEFQDKPSNVDDYFNRLNRDEKNIYKKGYLSALHKLLEQISDSKLKIGYKIMDSESKKERIQLQSRLHILDVYEDYYTQVATQMQEELELQP